MATPNRNHVNFEKRLAFIQALFKEHFHVEEPVTIAPIQYKEDYFFKYNNFVYKVTLPLNAHVHVESQQPGCSLVPEHANAFLLRLTNADAADMNTFNRVENEVATISLVSTALKHIEPHVVPSVYAWHSAAVEGSQGWILQEFMPGVQVDTVFAEMSDEQKRSVFSQMAMFLDGIQKFKLPEGVTQLGGLNFDAHGRIVTDRMASIDAGPWSSYEAYFQERMTNELQQVSENPYIQGWNANDVRARLEAFIEKGIPARFQSLPGAQDMGIVHGDIAFCNLLVDPSTARLTALLDYDFACISHPAQEFFHSFIGKTNGGAFHGWSGDASDEDMALRHAKLHGFPDPLPPTSGEDGAVDWGMAKMWEEELERRNVRRPRTIAGIADFADLDAVSQGIVPWRLTNEDILPRQTEEVKVKFRAECERRLSKMLERLGY